MEHIEAYDFGTFLRQLRKQKRLSQNELASRLGLGSRGTIDAWEQGKQRPQTIERVVDLAEALALSDHEREMLFAAYFSPIFEESKVHHHLERHDCYPDFRLPVHYFRSVPLFSAIRALLTSNITGTKRRSLPPPTPIALHGMGGIGKSVIARDLCDDPLVRAAFPDGILWITLGKDPKLRAGMRTWVNALGGTISENAPTVANFKQTLMDLLRDRTCLLILDDVWKHTNAEQFFVGGPRCRVLLTTRYNEIAYELGATVQPIPLMAELQAVRLLEAWSNEQLVEATFSSKAHIVKRLGYLPLAVKLAGAQLRRKAPDEWLRHFDIHKLKSRRPETIHDDLVHTFELSLEDLAEDQRQLYTALAIFREGKAINQAGVERLWEGFGGIDAETTIDLLDDLASRALLEVASDHSSRSIHLHNLLRDLASSELGEEGRIQAHRALLKAYRTTCKGRGWHTSRHDSYLFDNLAYHLRAVGAVDELKGLFADQQWLHVRVPQCDYTYDGYLDDLSLAWESAREEADRQIEAGEEPSSFANCVRYALIRTSINSLASNYSPMTVARAVGVGLWSADRALSVAAKNSDSAVQVEMYLVLLESESLSAKQREEAQQLGLKAALSPWDEREHPAVLKILAAHLAEEQSAQSAEEMLKAILALRKKRERVKTLVALAPQLGGEARIQTTREVLEIAMLLPWWERAAILTKLIPYLTGKQDIREVEEALEAARALPMRALAETVAALASQLAGIYQITQDALEAALALEDKAECAQVLITMVPYLTDEQRVRAIQVALTAASALAPQKRTEIVERLAPFLNEEQHLKAATEAMEAALPLEDEEERIETLGTLIPHLSGTQRIWATTKVLDALALPKEWRMLIFLFPYLTAGQRREALRAAFEALQTLSAWECAEMIVSLMPLLTEEQRTQIAENVSEVALLLLNEESHVELLESLIPYLAGEQLVRAIEKVLARASLLADEGEREQVLIDLVPHLEGNLREQLTTRTLKATLRFWDGEERAEILAVLAPHLNEEQLKLAVQEALKLRDEEECARVLAVLIPRLTGELRVQGVKLVLRAAQVLPVREYAQVLISLAPHLAAELLGQVVQAAQGLWAPEERARVLATLIPYLKGDTRSQATGLALREALTLWHGRARVGALTTLIPNLTGELRVKMNREALEEALELTNEGDVIEALVGLAPHLVDELRIQACERLFEGVSTLSDGWERAWVLADLAPLLPGNLHERWLEAFGSLTSAWQRTWVLAAILSHSPDHTSLLKPIRQAMIAELAAIDHWPRKQMLQNYFIEEFFSPPVLSPETLGDIALHLIEICEQWDWL